MNKYEKFINYFNALVAEHNIVVPDDVMANYNAMIKSGEKEEKKVLTDSGAEVLLFVQDQKITGGTAKNIAEKMGSSSRKVSGSMRKLVEEGFVEKIGDNPVMYSLTDKGRNFDVMKYKREND